MFYFSVGLTLGLASALAPGPLVVLVISETLKGNWKNGLLISISPLITDPLIITLVILIISELSNKILGYLSIAGGFFLLYLAFENITFKMNEIPSSGKSLFKGVVTNFLNPNPYIFWFTVGGPLLIKSWSVNKIFALLFILSFYISFIGLKLLLAILVSKFRVFNQTIYSRILKAFSVVFIILGLVFIWNGIKMM